MLAALPAMRKLHQSALQSGAEQLFVFSGLPAIPLLLHAAFDAALATAPRGLALLKRRCAAMPGAAAACPSLEWMCQRAAATGRWHA